MVGMVLDGSSKVWMVGWWGWKDGGDDGMVGEVGWWDSGIVGWWGWWGK